MPRLVRLLAALPLFALLLFAPSEASADPLVITSGHVRIGGVFPPGRGTFRSVNYNFSGQGFAVSGGAGDGSVQRTGSCTFLPCAPGTVIDGNEGVGLQGVGTTTIDGLYSGVAMNLNSGLTFITGNIAIPISLSPTITLQTPFTMTGILFVQAPVNGAMTTIFSSQISGQGMATFTFSQFELNGITGYVLHTIEYDFAAAAEVPEPATVMLLGAGLAGLAARSRRRRRPAP